MPVKILGSGAKSCGLSGGRKQNLSYFGLIKRQYTALQNSCFHPYITISM